MPEIWCMYDDNKGYNFTLAFVLGMRESAQLILATPTRRQLAYKSGLDSDLSRILMLEIKKTSTDMDLSFELTTGGSTTGNSIPEDTGVAKHSSFCLESTAGGFFENNWHADIAASQEYGLTPTTSTFSEQDCNPDKWRSESKTRPGVRVELRYRTWRRVKIAGLVAMAVMVWGLLLLPVVVYYIPAVSNLLPCVI